MPTYDFRCQDCGQVSEIFVRSLDSEVKCPNCGSENMERLLSSSFRVVGPTVGVSKTGETGSSLGVGRGLRLGQGLGRGRGRGWGRRRR